MASESSENQDGYWTAYERAHEGGAARAVHLLGTTGALGCALFGLARRRGRLLALAPALAWAAAALACGLSPEPRLALVAPWTLLRASARLYLRTLSGRRAARAADSEADGRVDAPQPRGDQPQGDQPRSDGGANGKSHRVKLGSQADHVKPTDPGTLN